MEIVIDTSAIIAVIVDEPEREKIIELTRGNTLIGPGSIPWEIGNAFSAMFKKNRVSLAEAEKGLEIFKKIPIRSIETNFANAVTISQKTNIYAYDAYFLDCALRQKAPLLTLDSKLCAVAKSLKISTLEA
ncbi:putative nucleic acid-binding protein [Desulfobotulus alkaliphilus]|uniref:Putative nucleic acid-binding protein n=1 Tax=Desulfobotulus alkaliphilus TaxID=622671 RepID=A0A562R095_9BACT|nr:type II toxin-antitoxin system VapC family toxin [Desulfobotulus alkaliphilus]TWI62457.1 putative nucleic acid-binding protein [Desulfobotulus alkaliphilus]